MATEIIIVSLGAIFAVVAVVEFFVYQKNRKEKKDLVRREEDAQYKMYEIAVLNELSEKMGYSLGVQNVIEVIIKTLPDFIDYTAVAYMILLPEKINFRTYVKEIISSKFISEVKEKMLGSLGDNFRRVAIEDKIWGANINDESKETVKSFFNIPIEVNGNLVGLITVASSKDNFYKEKQITTLQKIASSAVGAVKRLQDVVETENSKMNALVASMTDGVVMSDMDYRVLVVNPAAKKAAGLEDKNNLSLSDFSEGVKDKIDLKDKIEESIRLDNIFVSDEVLLADRFFKIVVSPVKDEQRTLGCVIVFRDMTHEKEVQKIKDDFTSMIVHELRSPLDSIKKMVELMRSSTMKKAESANCLQMVYGSSSDMLELINNLLDVAKIEAGKFSLTKQPSDIREVIKDRIMFFDIAAKDANVRLVSKLGESVPDKILFDPHTISQVLNNLISNALKFNKENGSIEVQALMHKKGENLQKEAKGVGISWFITKDVLDIPDSLFVAVTNTGAGIAKDQIDKLFNKFVQVKTVFAKKGGTGLGLAITKSIIESHGGIVGAESTEGEGATFYFTVPLSEPDEKTETATGAPVKIK